MSKNLGFFCHLLQICCCQHTENCCKETCCHPSDYLCIQLLIKSGCPKVEGFALSTSEQLIAGWLKPPVIPCQEVTILYLLCCGWAIRVMLKVIFKLNTMKYSADIFLYVFSVCLFSCLFFAVCLCGSCHLMLHTCLPSKAALHPFFIRLLFQLQWS